MNAQTNAQTAAAPAINLSQIDTAQLGDVNNSVNLYRGDVNLPLTLVSLPERGGLQAKVNAFYGSNVQNQVNTWNMEEPTGLLGVGWRLLTSKIVADFKENKSHTSAVFYLKLEGQNHLLKRVGYDGNAILYQTKDFKFWKILYYQSEERWEVTNESGIVYTFGGDLIDNSDPSAGSQKNRCDFGVSWDNWVGSSTSDSGSMFVKGWNLGTVENLWGEQIFYEYESTTAYIGGSTSYYTRSSRLATITDVNNRKIQLIYNPKSSYEKQYPDVPPQGENNAYQFDYEDSYLDRIEVVDENNTLLSKVELSYSHYNLVDNSDNNFKKRYLVTVTNYNNQNQAQPSLNLEYYTSPSDINKGALKNIYYPTGASAQYTYDSGFITSVDTSTTILPPIVDKREASKPRIFYGPDYVVTTWWREDDLFVQVYSWIGEWVRFEKKLNDVNADIDTLEVLPHTDFFALSFKDTSNNNYHLHLFHEDIYQEGKWIDFEANTSNYNTNMQIAAGDDFVVCVQQGSQSGEQVISVSTYYWNISTKEWDFNANLTSQSFIPAQNFSVVARGNYFFLAYQNATNDAIKCQLFYQNEADTWISSPSNEYSLSNYGHVHWSAMDAKRMMAAGSTFVGMTFVVATGDDTNLHNLLIIDWDSDFQITPNTQIFKKGFSIPTPMGYQPPYVEGALVAAGHKLVRFTGESWLLREMDKPSDNQPFYKTYGSDSGIIVKLDNNNFKYYSYEFDPYTRSWSSGSQLDSISNEDIDSPNPSIRGNFRTIGQYLDYRDSQLNWNTLVNLGSHIDTTTIRNQAPIYLSTLTSNNQTAICFISNGNIKTYTTLPFDGVVPGATALAAYNKIDGDNSIDDVRSFKLYRITKKDEITDNPMDYSVSQLSVNNGNETINTYYTFDRDSATYDPFGLISQFTNITVCKGSPTGAYGKTEYQYFAGQDPNKTDVTYEDSDDYTNVKDYYSLFKGKLYKQIDYNSENVVVHQLVNSWKAFLRNDIYGAYTRLTQKNEMNDGVYVVRQYYYNDQGQSKNEITYNTDSYGHEIKMETLTRYGWEDEDYTYPAYSEMLNANLLTAIIQKTTQVTNTTLQTPPEITKSSVSTWKNTWLGTTNSKQWAASKSYLWKGTGSSEFDFTRYSDGQEPPNGWLKTRETKSRTTTGQAIETVNIDGVCTTQLYDKDGRFPINQFINADATEVLYTGFEPYEDLSDWATIDEFMLDRRDVFTGTRSLRLANWTVSRVLYPNKNNQVFLLGYWMKTMDGFIENENMSYINSTMGATSISFPIRASNDWTFQLMELDFSEEGTNQSLALMITNDQTHNVLIDNIFLCPADGGFGADIFETPFMLNTANLGLRGEVTRTVYDAFQKPIINTDVEQQVNKLRASYRWRDFYNYQSIDNALFNFDLGVEIKDESTLYNFNKNDQWNETWIGSNSTSGNSATEYSLLLRNSIQYHTFALRFNLDISDPSNPFQFSINFGDYTIAFDFANYEWILSSSNSVTSYATLGASLDISRDYLLLVHDNNILFLEDGKILLQHPVDEEVIGSNTAQLEITSTEDFHFDYLMLAYSPITALTYLDNAGNISQEQRLVDNNKTCVRATLYDDLGRRIIRTKPIEYDSQCFSYRATLVTNLDSALGVMTGDVADYYSNNGEEADDEGYPYSRKRFEDSTLGRLIEIGAPGQDFAIIPYNPSDTIETNTRHTKQISYRNNENITFFPDLPSAIAEDQAGNDSAQYYYILTKDQDNNKSAQLIDKLGNVIGECKGMADETFGSSNSVVTRNVYDNSGNLIKVIYPNAYANGLRPDANTTNWIMAIEYDFLGNTLSRTYPDAQKEQYAYTLSGRLRFRQDANGINYYTDYDELGRKIEEGTTTTSWSNLSNNAANSNYTVPYKTVKRTYEYGTFADGISQIGRLQRIYYPDGTYIAYTYDLKGQTSSVKDTSLNSSHFGYTYNSRGDVKGIQDISNLFAYDVAYSYNASGQLAKAVVNSNHQTAKVDYQYNAGGGITSRSYTTNDESFLEETMDYNSLGRLTELSSSYFTEQLTYTEGGYNNKGFYSGKIASVSGSFTNTGFSDNGFSNIPQYKFDYDNRGQLITAQFQNKTSSVYNIGVSFPTEYDNNGNINQWEYSGQEQVNQLYDQSNKIYNQSNNQNNNQYIFNYDQKGNTTSSILLSNISWDQMSQQPLTMTTQGGLNLNFEYNHFGQRIKKVVAGTGVTTEYGLGMKNIALKRVELENGTIQDARYYLYGPKGLLLIIHATKNGQPNPNPHYYALKDHQGSVRAVVQPTSYNQTSLVGAYNYTPFGLLLGNSFEQESDLTFYYRYTGQEYDSETGLYNYKDRVYDPTLGRFYSLDPKMQFSSPYLYAGNDPILYTDFTGDMSGASIGGLVIGGILAAAGVAVLSAAFLSSWTGVGGFLAVTIGGALIGAGTAAISYSMSHRGKDEFSWAAFGIEMAIGGAIGAFSGGIGAALESEGEQIVGRAAINGLITGFATFGQDLTNLAIEDQPITFKNVCLAAVDGVIAGGIAFGTSLILMKSSVPSKPGTVETEVTEDSGLLGEVSASPAAPSTSAASEPSLGFTFRVQAGGFILGNNVTRFTNRDLTAAFGDEDSK